MIELVQREKAVTFAVRVVPRASRDAIEGEWQGGLKIRLTAPPVDDRANQALRRLLAERLEVPLGAVRIISRKRRPSKRGEVPGGNGQPMREIVGGEGSGT